MKKLKKILATSVILGLFLMGMTSVVYASELEDTTSGTTSMSDTVLEKNRPKYVSQEGKNLRQRYRYQLASNDIKLDKKYISAKFKGVWKYDDSEEIDGYIAGVIIKRVHRPGGFFKAVWNTTDGTPKGKIKGIYRFGYFAGKVITNNGTKPIVGFYKKVSKNDQDDINIYNLKWMMPKESGVGKIKVIKV